MNLAKNYAKVQKRLHLLSQMSELKRRHMLSVTLKPDLLERCKAEAAKLDIPVTAWARRAILEKLERIG